MNCTIISNGFEKNFLCKNEYEEPYISLKAKLQRIIWQSFCDGCTDFYVNCEYGIQLWVAEIICELKQNNNIFLHVVVPYEEQCKNWEENLRDRYYSVHEKSDSITLVSSFYNSDCYDKAQEFMINICQKVIILGERPDKIKTDAFL